MSKNKAKAHRILCFAGQFDDDVVKEMERYADARAYHIGGALMLCRRKPMGQAIIDRAKSFGWTVQPLPPQVQSPPMKTDAQTANIAVSKPSPSGLIQAQRNQIAREFVEYARSGDWKKPRKL